MKEYEITFKSCNSANYPKRITAYIVEPGKIDKNTGMMHFAHGWGGNRYQYQEMQREFANRYNLICVATEYRQSGYDFDAITGRGACLPYDFSHLQVIDCLNTLRKTLEIYPRVNKKRIISFGGSQGGHISMLMAIFAPNTFCLAISGSAISHIDSKWRLRAGRNFSEDELAVRNVVKMASLIQCPVVLMHGTRDENVSENHTHLLEEALLSAKKRVRVKYYKGAGHMLEPVTNRQKATIELANDLLKNALNNKRIDFKAKSKIVIHCPTKNFVIDWSKRTDAYDLVK